MDGDIECLQEKVVKILVEQLSESFWIALLRIVVDTERKAM